MRSKWKFAGAQKKEGKASFEEKKNSVQKLI